MEKGSGRVGMVTEESLRAETWFISEEERVEDKSLQGWPGGIVRRQLAYQPRFGSQSQLS